MNEVFQKFLLIIVIIPLFITGCATTQSPLMLASFACDTDTVRTLLDKGANVNAKDIKGRTPLFLCSPRRPFGDCKSSA